MGNIHEHVRRVMFGKRSIQNLGFLAGASSRRVANWKALSHKLRHLQLNPHHPTYQRSDSQSLAPQALKS